MFDFEGALLSKIVRDGNIVPALEARVSERWFEDPDHRSVWKLLQEHFNSYGEVLSPRLLRYERPDYTLVETEESLSVYLDRMRARHRDNLLRDAIIDATRRLEEGEGDEATDLLTRGLTRVHTEVTTLRDVNLIDTWEKRVEKYLWYSENRDKLLGIPMGIPSIDSALSGFQPEQLITFVGKQKSSKSYLLMHAAITAHRYGYTPLFVGFEMSNDEQAARHDALISKVDHNKLVQGDSTEKMRKQVEKSLKSRKNMHPFILSADPSGGNTVSAIGAKVEQYNPDIIFVDGVYLMEDEEGGYDERTQLTNITRGFKRLAQRLQKPIVITTQALEWKIGRKGLQTSSVGYSSSFGQDSDALIGTESVDEEEDPGLKRLKILDARNAPRMSTLIRWDFENGSVEELEDSDESEPYDALVEAMD